MNEGLINVVLIEDDNIIRESYAFLINQHADYNVINTYSSIEQALLKIKHDDPHVILLDIQLPGKSGVEGLPLLKKQVDDVHVIMLTTYDNPEQVFTALSNGASGYLTKDATPEIILDAIQDVLNGGGPMTSKIANMVVRSFQRNQATPLTKRETEILELLAQGKTRSRIAQEIFVDAETVKSHLKNIYAKLDVHSKADAIAVARDKKYI